MRPHHRLLFVALTVALGACADIATPSPRQLKPTTPSLNIIDSSMCRSGYNMAQGRCND